MTTDGAAKAREYRGLVAARYAEFELACVGLGAPRAFREIVERAFYAGAIAIWQELGKAQESGDADGQTRADAIRDEIFAFAGRVAELEDAR